MYKKRGSLMFIGLSILLLVGCAKAEKEANTVRIANFPNITHAQALLGFAQDTFAEKFGKEIQVENKIFNAGPAEIEAFLAGEVDLGYIGPGPAINGNIKTNGEIVILGGAAKAGALLVAAAESNIVEVADLANKKVAVPQLGNTQHLLLLKLLADHGLKDKNQGGNVEIVAAENADIQTLLENGEIDGAIVPEPWASRLQLENGAKVVLDQDQLFREGDYPTTVLIGRKAFIEKNPELVRQFIEANAALTVQLNTDQVASSKSINEQLNAIIGKPLKQEVIDLALSRIYFDSQVNQDALSEFSQLLVNQGILEELPDMHQVVELRFGLQ